MTTSPHTTSDLPNPEHAMEFEERARTALERDPPDGDSIHALGIEACSTGRPDAALELFSRAVEVEPGKASYFVSIGRLLAYETMFNQSALAYLRARELGPNDPIVLTELAGVLKHLDKPDEAIALLDRAAELQRKPGSLVVQSQSVKVAVMLPGKPVCGAPLLVDGVRFEDLHLYGDANGSSIIGRSHDGKHFLKVEVRHNPLKKHTLEGERKIIQDLNRNHCVTCPTLTSHGTLPRQVLERCLTPHGREVLASFAQASYSYIIQQLVPSTGVPSLGDILLAVLEQKSMGIFHADLRPENLRMDTATGVCYLIDYDQAERLDETTRNLDNLDFFTWCDSLIREKYRRWNFQHFLHYFPNINRERDFAVLFRNGAFNLGTTRLFSNQITTAAKAGVYHTVREKAVYIDGERSLDSRRTYLDAIAFAPGERVLDVGCSSGIISTYLARRGCKVTGIDLDPEIILGCRILSHILGNDITFLHHDLDTGPVPGEFDTVLLFSVIHHTKNMQANAVMLANQSRRIVIECRLAEGGLKPSPKIGWQKTSGWSFPTVDDMVAGLERLFPGFHLHTNHGKGDRERFVLEFTKTG